MPVHRALNGVPILIVIPVHRLCTQVFVYASSQSCVHVYTAVNTAFYYDSLALRIFFWMAYTYSLLFLFTSFAQKFFVYASSQSCEHVYTAVNTASYCESLAVRLFFWTACTYSLLFLFIACVHKLIVYTSSQSCVHVYTTSYFESLALNGGRRTLLIAVH